MFSARDFAFLLSFCDTCKMPLSKLTITWNWTCHHCYHDVCGPPSGCIRCASDANHVSFDTCLLHESHTCDAGLACLVAQFENIGALKAEITLGQLCNATVPSLTDHIQRCPLVHKYILFWLQQYCESIGFTVGQQRVVLIGDVCPTQVVTTPEIERYKQTLPEAGCVCSIPAGMSAAYFAYLDSIPDITVNPATNTIARSAAPPDVSILDYLRRPENHTGVLASTIFLLRPEAITTVHKLLAAGDIVAIVKPGTTSTLLLPT